MNYIEKAFFFVIKSSNRIKFLNIKFKKRKNQTNFARMVTYGTHFDHFGEFLMMSFPHKRTARRNDPEVYQHHQQ